MANWFECKIRYDKTQENGSIKKVTEPYLVDALSFTEAEARIIEEQAPFISGEVDVNAVKRTRIAEIMFDDSADKWYLVKVAFITIDEKTAVSPWSNCFWLKSANVPPPWSFLGRTSGNTPKQPEPKRHSPAPRPRRLTQGQTAARWRPITPIWKTSNAT